MTTNLNAIAGPSKLPSPKVEAPSPTPTEIRELSSGPPITTGTVNKQGLSITEDGEMVKVPAFLNKLFSMVSTPDTDTLIYWSDSGDSFFIPNSERFGKELLPRFFKHNNFSSFVRQLNMYGFHKVPHLQTGALRNDNLDASELWEFVNPFFKRGQSHLLSRVSRKNNRPGQANSSAANSSAPHDAAPGVVLSGNSRVHLITDGTTQGESNLNSGTLVGPTGQQVLDLSAITSGIAAIQRTQASIGADLKALQSSNEHLWREALEQRERHKTHQETIDLIVQFLERLFGTEGEGLKGLKEALRRGGLGRSGSGNVGGGPAGSGDAVAGGDDLNGVTGSARKKRRMGLDRMISDGRDLDGDEDGILELGNDSHRFRDNMAITRRTRSRTDNPAPSSATTTSSDPWTSASQRFTTLDDSTSGTTTPLNSIPPSSQLQQGDQTLSAAHVSPMSDTDGFDPNTLALAPYSYNNYQHQPQMPPAFATGAPSVQVNGSNPPPLSPNSTAAAAAAFNLDPSLLQTTIGSLLQSPAAAQMFLNSLHSSTQAHTLSNTQSNPGPQFTTNPPGLSHQQFPFPNLNQIHTNSSNSTINANIDPTLALFSPLPNQEILQGNNEALLKSYQDALSVGGDMDRLQEGIDSLVRSMGLDLPGQGGDAHQHQQQQQPQPLQHQQHQHPHQQNRAMMGNGNGTGLGMGMDDLSKGDDSLNLDMGDSDFDVDQFLESLGRDDEHVDMTRMNGDGVGSGRT